MITFDAAAAAKMMMINQNSIESLLFCLVFIHARVHLDLSPPSWAPRPHVIFPWVFRFCFVTIQMILAYTLWLKGVLKMMINMTLIVNRCTSPHSTR